MINVLYEADDKCIAELEQINRGRSAEVIIVNRCISGKSGQRTFCDAHHGYGSSLLEANPELASLNIPAHWIDYDYTVYEAISARERRKIETITLDDLVASDPAIPPPGVIAELWYDFVQQFKHVVDKYPVLLQDTFAERHSGAHPLGCDGFASMVKDQFAQLEASVGQMPL